MFQKFQGAGNVGLAAVEGICGKGEVFVFGSVIKNTVVFVVDVHVFRHSFPGTNKT